MLKDEGYCNRCGQKLRTRENDASILLVCTNQKCCNYWINKGAEITMLLK